MLTQCPACGHLVFQAWPQRRDLKLRRCAQCHLVFQGARPQADTLRQLYDEDYYDPWLLGKFQAAVWEMKVKTFTEYLWLVDTLTGGSRGAAGQLLDIGCAHGFMLEAGQRLGYRAYGVEISPAAEFARQRGFQVTSQPVEEADLPPASFDTITLIDVIEHFERPRDTLARIGQLLKPGGFLFILTPDVASGAARLWGNRWPHYLPEHLCYYSASSLSYLLQAVGLEVVVVRKGFKFLTLNYIVKRLQKHPGGPASDLLAAIAQRLPQRWTNRPGKYTTEMMCLAKRPGAQVAPLE